MTERLISFTTSASEADVAAAMDLLKAKVVFNSSQTVAAPEPKAPRKPKKVSNLVHIRKLNRGRVLNVPASLEQIGITENYLMARSWPKGSDEHSLKLAIAHNRVIAAAAA